MRFCLWYSLNSVSLFLCWNPRYVYCDSHSYFKWELSNWVTILWLFMCLLFLLNTQVQIWILGLGLQPRLNTSFNSSIALFVDGIKWSVSNFRGRQKNKARAWSCMFITVALSSTPKCFFLSCWKAWTQNCHFSSQLFFKFKSLLPIHVQRNSVNEARAYSCVYHGACVVCILSDRLRSVFLTISYDMSVTLPKCLFDSHYTAEILKVLSCSQTRSERNIVTALHCMWLDNL